MKQEITVTGRTVEAAVAEGASQLGVPVANVEYEVVEAPRKGFLGFGEVLATVRVFCHEGPDVTALRFVTTLLDNMGLDATAELCPDNISNGDRMINITGEDAGVLIGHHGETLDGLQYIVNLVANKKEDDDEAGKIKITVDIENYRKKREETLRRLARSVAMKVKKYRKSITLEPMSPYERRIIHSEIQTISGVSTNSIGSDNNRRVVVYYESRGYSKGGRSNNSSGNRNPAPAQDEE
ncbi:MAG: protein jag [Clostridia bacterium]|nr:protein jag [Clostridia bacterium]